MSSWRFYRLGYNPGLLVAQIVPSLTLGALSVGSCLFDIPHRVCVCVCVCVREREREREKERGREGEGDSWCVWGCGGVCGRVEAEKQRDGGQETYLLELQDLPGSSCAVS